MQSKRRTGRCCRTVSNCPIDPDILRKKAAIDICNHVKALARDVEPFLFSAAEAKKVLAFPDYIKQLH